MRCSGLRPWEHLQVRYNTTREGAGTKIFHHFSPALGGKKRSYFLKLQRIGIEHYSINLYKKSFFCIIYKHHFMLKSRMCKPNATLQSLSEGVSRDCHIVSHLVRCR